VERRSKLEKPSSVLVFNRKKELLNKTVLTTKEAAELIGVSLPSIINWADSGQFGSFRTPGGHRRIRTREFLHFARQKGYPLPSEENPGEQVSVGNAILIIDKDLDYADAVKDFLELTEDVEVQVCSDAFWAGFVFAKMKASVVVIDQGTMIVPENFEQQIATLISDREVKLVILSNLLGTTMKIDTQRGHIRISKSHSIREVAGYIASLIER